MPTPDPERLRRVLGGEGLAGLRQRLRRRYAASDTPPDRFTLTHLASAEAEALAGLLGRARRPRASMQLSHGAIDAALHDAGLADDLRAALETLDGPITDTAAARERRRRAWSEAFGQATDSRLARILAEPGVQGLVKRLAGRDVAAAERLIAQAECVLARLPGDGLPLARLAADTLGDAHGLDTGRPVATLVRRALAEPGAADSRPRELWADQGVLVNELAKPVATLNLVATGDDPGSHLVATAATAGEPLHLSLRLLGRQAPAWRTGQHVFVCENPEVVSAAADALGARCPPMISLDGQLSAAPRTLLDQLAAAGARLVYHGDFDWPGLRIANHIVARYGAAPWRYSAPDYRPDNGPPLVGEPVEAAWDAALATRMRAANVAVHEESQLDTLIADLAGAGKPE